MGLYKGIKVAREIAGIIQRDKGEEGDKRDKGKLT